MLFAAGITERAQQQMELHFPDFPTAWLWQRKANDGYTTLPRTLPIAMQAIDDETKGRPAGHTLFCLWARSPDHPMLVIDNPATYAGEAGFSGERAVDTWRKRMKQLAALNFIRCTKGTSGDFHYVLLLNPNAAVATLYAQGKVQKGLYGRFLDRMNEIGAQQDFTALQEYSTALAEAAKKEATEAANTLPPPPA